MLRRSLSLGLLVASAAAAPAAAHGRSALFPSLKAAGATSSHARRVERRTRRIETSLLGPGHAAEHARQRVLRRQLERRAAADPRARAAAALPNDNTLAPWHLGGRWEDGVKLPVIAINAVLMHTGKVLIFAYPWRPGRPDPDNPGQTLGDPGYATAYVFDPATGGSVKVDPPIDPNTGKPAYIFCAGTSTLPDGRVLVVGGDVGSPIDPQSHGLNTIYTFDPVSETWATQQRTRQGRWYPTQLEMADGRTLILAGLPNTTDPDWPDRVNKDIEIFSPDGTLQKLDSVRADFGDGQPIQPGHATVPGQYPHAFWMPSGHALIAGPRKTDTWAFTPPTPGADDAGVQDRTDIPEFREWASGALLPGTSAAGSTRIMLFGGSDKDDHYSGSPAPFPAVSSTRVYDEATDAWSAGPAMHVARSFSNSVLLPDGKVAVVGGGSGEDPSSPYYRWLYSEADKRVDLFDPATNNFTFGNAQAEARTYHSTALLLPDGRVMSAGDDINGPTGPDSGVRTDTAEMWRPPYLYDSDDTGAARPTITAAPATIAYGKPFHVGTPDDIQRAVLVAPGAVTHDNDMSQRVVALDAPVPVAGGGGVNLQAPANANLAPPGYYMLFVLDGRGVPSVARFVQLGDQPPGPGPTPTASPTTSPPPSPTPSPTATPTPTPRPPAFKVRITAKAPKLAKLARTGRLDAKVSLSDAGRVKLGVALEHRGRRGKLRLKALASTRTLTFTGAVTRKVHIRLTRAGRRRLKHRHAATARLTATASPISGARVKATRRLKLRRR